jgi:hypothetical protein
LMTTCADLPNSKSKICGKNNTLGSHRPWYDLKYFGSLPCAALNLTYYHNSALFLGLHSHLT